MQKLTVHAPFRNFTPKKSIFVGNKIIKKSHFISKSPVLRIKDCVQFNFCHLSTIYPHCFHTYTHLTNTLSTKNSILPTLPCLMVLQPPNFWERICSIVAIVCVPAGVFWLTVKNVERREKAHRILLKKAFLFP